jgi:hypothetical protein
MMKSVITSVEIALPDWNAVFFMYLYTNQNPYDETARIIGNIAKNRSFKKNELNRLPPPVIPDWRKQSMLNTCVDADAAGAVDEKRLSICEGHWKLKEDTSSISCRWFIRILM